MRYAGEVTIQEVKEEKVCEIPNGKSAPMSTRAMGTLPCPLPDGPAADPAFLPLGVCGVCTRLDEFELIEEAGDGLPASEEPPT